MAEAANEDKITVVIVDDHTIVRQGLRTYLELQPDVLVVGEAANGSEAMALVKDNLPDIVLMDLVMPVMDGVDATRAITAMSPSTRVIVLTSFSEDEKVFASIKAGAQGYLLKDMFFEELEDAIRKVHAGARRLPSVVAERLAERMNASELTVRELEVLQEIVKGKTNKEIASTLRISEATVKSHINNILGKLGVTDRTQAATRALQRGIVHL